MTIFFTSDQHIGHGNIIKHCKRPFSSLGEMENVIVERWNNVVSNLDTVYCLGDFCYRNPYVGQNRFYQLNGRKHLVLGNHDDKKIKRLQWSSVIEGYCSLMFQDVMIILSHYSMRAWNKSHYGSIHLFGHSHGTLPTYGRSFDVGVDCWNFTPISLEEVIAFAEKIKETQYLFDFESRTWKTSYD